MKLLKTALFTASILAAASAQALTVFSPTVAICGCDQDVDFLNVISSNDSNKVFLFDSALAGQNITVAQGLEVLVPSDVKFKNTAGAYSAINGGGASIELGNSADFFLAVLVNGQLITDTSAVQQTNAYGNPLDVYRVAFGDATSIQLVDVQEVPVPAAVWLFGSAMLGLAGVKRRK